MTTTKQKNTQTANNTTPTNVKNKKISQFENLLNLSNKTDKELFKLNITKTTICDDIVKMYKDLDFASFENKQVSDYQTNNIYLRKKGIKNQSTAKPLTGTFKTVISAVKSYLKDNQVIDKATTYKTIRKYQNDKNKTVISENRKAYNKELAKLSDKVIKAFLLSQNK